MFPKLTKFSVIDCVKLKCAGPAVFIKLANLQEMV